MGGDSKPPVTPVLCAVTPTPTSLTLGFPRPHGRGKKMGQLSEEPWIEARGEVAPAEPVTAVPTTKLLLALALLRRSIQGGRWETFLPGVRTVPPFLLSPPGTGPTRVGWRAGRI